MEVCIFEAERVNSEGVVYSKCTDCGEELAEDEVYGEWDDLCVTCYSDRDTNTCKHCGKKLELAEQTDDQDDVCADCYFDPISRK